MTNTNTTENKVEAYALLSVLRNELNPLQAIGMLTMQVRLHKNGQCDCGKSVAFLEEVIEYIASIIIDEEGDED